MEILYAIVAILAVIVAYLVWKIRKLEDQVTGMQFIKVEKTQDGGWKFTSRDGKSIFEL
jgi:hypothetical protein